MISLYVPGTSLLHRAPAWSKLLGLVLATLVLSVWGGEWPVLTGAAALTIAAFLASVGVAELWRQLWGLRWLLVIMLVPQLIFLPWQLALTNTSRVVIVVALAGLVTSTTRMTELLDTLEAALRPLRPLGVRPDRIALLLSLTISTVPLIAALATQLREALIARGRRGTSVRILFPLLVLTLQHADELTDALRARGLD
ncbi:energy-coupling factor transporter transmembrane component T family protein [Gulosibacter sp. ACHW.36C]|uniref:Energy-coupling factor transporter transmembrane protein EcfT n=1 Tax=Gulosibacter sediminis TaxID=1729695 RepID=A0ABY4MWH1_9MICO|nr:energy-coupling factor transporter transmembrane component T [Gulosibacter sediminis]UQN13736.1 energy-coupling factor transporter transmembrane protein EcfT [Gulosibacter sediminis]